MYARAGGGILCLVETGVQTCALTIFLEFLVRMMDLEDLERVVDLEHLENLEHLMDLEHLEHPKDLMHLDNQVHHTDLKDRE